MRMRRLGSICAPLYSNPTLWNLVVELEAHFPVEAIDYFLVDGPAVTLQQHVNTTVAVAHTGLTDVPELQFLLLAAPGLVYVKRPVGSSALRRHAGWKPSSPA